MRRSSFCTRIYQSQRFFNSRDLIRQRGGWWPTLEAKCQHRRYNVIQESRAGEFSALQRLITPGDASQNEFSKELFLYYNWDTSKQKYPHFRPYVHYL
jgi:hypothetical protein